MKFIERDIEAVQPNERFIFDFFTSRRDDHDFVTRCAQYAQSFDDRLVWLVIDTRSIKRPPVFVIAFDKVPAMVPSKSDITIVLFINMYSARLRLQPPQKIYLYIPPLQRIQAEE